MNTRGQTQSVNTAQKPKEFKSREKMAEKHSLTLLPTRIVSNPLPYRLSVSPECVAYSAGNGE